MLTNKVAVLLATFNGGDFVEKQIESIMRQEEVDLDIYISDDGSTDNTLNIIYVLQKKYKNIFLLKPRKNKLGPGNNFYRLIKYLPVNGYNFISFSDQDDIWSSRKLSRALDVLKNLNVDGYSSDAITFKGDMKKTSYLKKSYPQKRYDYLFEGPGPGCTFVLSKSLFLKIQEFLSTTKTNFLFHDWLIYAVARSNNFSWHIDNMANIFYRQHDNNFFGSHQGFLSSIYRFRLVLNGEWSRVVCQLFDILDIENLNDMNIKRRRVYFLNNLFQTRRRWSHALINAILITFMRESK